MNREKRVVISLGGCVQDMGYERRAGHKRLASLITELEVADTWRCALGRPKNVPYWLASAEGRAPRIKQWTRN